jgi:hypothetical protein
VHCARVVFACGGGIFGGCGGLFVCLCKSSTEDSGSGENDLGQYPVRLLGVRLDGRKE